MPPASTSGRTPNRVNDTGCGWPSAHRLHLHLRPDPVRRASKNPLVLLNDRGPGTTVNNENVMMRDYPSVPVNRSSQRRPPPPTSPGSHPPSSRPLPASYGDANRDPHPSPDPAG